MNEALDELDCLSYFWRGAAVVRAVRDGRVEKFEGESHMNRDNPYRFGIYAVVKEEEIK
jgi:hypothetical protein